MVRTSHQIGDQAPASAGGTALTLRAVSRTYGRVGQAQVRALDEVDLDLPRGSFTAVMGPSGSGKSTLLHCASGLEQVDSGQVMIGGHPVHGWGDARLTRFRRRHVGFVFQSYSLLPYLTAEQNVTLPLRLAGRRPERALVADLLERVELSEQAARLPGELSGGQQQRVALARALIAEPDVVFADEPTGALDQQAARRMLSMLRASVDEWGRTVLMVTHDPVAAARADRVVYLVDGRVVGRTTAPTAETVAEQMTRLDELARVPAGLS